jgi:queuine tRNA-ribosyltransferase
MIFDGAARLLLSARFRAGENFRMFTINKKDNKTKKRRGELQTKQGIVKTPVFMPIATYGAVKNLTGDEIKELGGEIILANAYHLWLRPGSDTIKKAGGLHSFMNWPRPILTDSGGFQVFSLGAKNSARGKSFFSPELAFPSAKREQFFGGKFVPAPQVGLVKITDKGVEFRDPYNGKRCFLTPEQSIQIQLDLGSEIIMVFDECPAYPARREEVERAAKRTTEWAGRCKKYFQERVIMNPGQAAKQSRSGAAVHGIAASSQAGLGAPRNDTGRPLLFGIIQGGVYKDLRQKSASELLKIGFDGYAIGGVAVGEPRKYLWSVLDWVLPMLPENKPRYLMGLGRPEEIAGAILAGIDMFDCVIPTREARHGRLYKFKSQNSIGQLTDKTAIQNAKFYETLQITKSKFAKKFQPIDKNCGCSTCRNYSLAYLNHLFKIKEGLGLRLAAIHNLSFYLNLVESLRSF